VRRRTVQVRRLDLTQASEIVGMNVAVPLTVVVGDLVVGVAELPLALG